MLLTAVDAVATVPIVRDVAVRTAVVRQVLSEPDVGKVGAAMLWVHQVIAPHAHLAIPIALHVPMITATARTATAITTTVPLVHSIPTALCNVPTSANLHAAASTEEVASVADVAEVAEASAVAAEDAAK